MNTQITPLLDGNGVGSVATLLEDGRPWSTPLHLAFDEENVYWLSVSDCQHSLNIAQRPVVSIAIWSPDRSQGLKGAYIQTVARPLDGRDAERGRQAYIKDFCAVPAALADAVVYGAPIGEKSTTRSRGNTHYFFADKKL